MLYLTRKIGESVIINNTIELTVVEVKGRGVKIGFRFPPEATILRKELHDRILEQNLESSRSSSDDADMIGSLGEFDIASGDEGNHGGGDRDDG